MDGLELQDAESGYSVKLDTFNGPLDLLLHLIRKQEINIYDIPVALITQQYLEYLSLMKTFNLSFAGEFLVMAATLLQIKSRMLLPKEDPPLQDEDDGEDPRAELVRQLVEYEQFKEAAATLAVREDTWRASFAREVGLQYSQEAPALDDAPADDLSLFDLVGALQRVLDRVGPEQTIIDVSREQVSVQDCIHRILERLEGEPSITFEALFDRLKERSMIIVTFLALLELVRMNLVRLFQGEMFGVIHVSRNFVPADV